MKNPASSTKKPGFFKGIKPFNKHFDSPGLSPEDSTSIDQAGLLTRDSQHISRLPGHFFNPVVFREPLPTYSGQTVRDFHPVPFSLNP